MAGNIIPAIATTNAIVAGLCVLQSFKVLKGEYAQSKEVFLTPFAPARLLAPDRSREPNPECPVCSVYFTSIVADLSRATLKDLVDDIVMSKLGFEGKEFVVNNDIGTLVECFEDGDDENLPKKLTDLGKASLKGQMNCSWRTDKTTRYQEGLILDCHRPGRRRHARQCGYQCPRRVCPCLCCY
jgi:hypothetical protein